MDRKKERELIEAVERDANDPDAWGDADPGPEGHVKRALSVSITFRLEPEHATALRAVASARGSGYTSLVRQWIEERLRLELAEVTPTLVQPEQVQKAGEAAKPGWTTSDHVKFSAA